MERARHDLFIAQGEIPVRKLGKKHYYLAASILLVVLLSESLYTISYNSPIFDETAHIGSGYYYWKTGNITLNREQPPLAKIVAGAPLALLDLKYPEGDWNNSKQLEFGRIFLYRTGNDLDSILFFSRLPIVALSLALGLVLFIFVSKIYGYKPAVFALFLYVFEATIISHGSLVTMDIALSLFMFLTMFALWVFAKDPNNTNAIFLAVCFALAQVSKFSALYLVPIILVLLLFFIHKRILGLNDVIRLILVTVIVSIFVINSFYLFQGTGKALTDNINKDRIEAHITNNPLKPLILAVANTPVPLPENYMLGLSDVILHDMSGSPAFFLGEYSRFGWWYYFPVLFMLKVSIFLMAFVFISIYFFNENGFEKNKDSRLAEYITIAFILMYFGINLFSHINIGIRHVLPIFPFVILFCSKSIKYANKNLIRLVVILAVFYALSSLLSAPHYITFFSEAVGGNEYMYAIDSNYDWGQDLKGLGSYMKANGITSVKLKYFGTAEPEYYGISYQQLECGKSDGIIAISANHLQELFASDRGCYKWLLDHEPIGRVGAIFIYDLRNLVQ